MIKELTLEQTRKHILNDPVRAHLTAEFRTTEGRHVWGLYNQHTSEPLAVICVAYTNAAPKNEQELAEFSSSTATTAVFYTVWSYSKGSGQQIVNTVAQHIQDTRPEIRRWVTLSPLTDMAQRFHTKNGALLHSVHDTAQIFEYTHLMREPA
jgi:hypothetical protein